MKTSKVVKFFNMLCIILLVVITFLALAQVLFRYVLQISVPWTEEFSRLLYGVLIFNGVVLLEAEKSQMKTTFLIDLMPKKVSYIIQIVLNILSIGFLLLMIIGSLRMVNSSWDITLGSLPFISQAVIYIPVILCMPFAIYYLVKQCINYKNVIVPQDIE